MPAMTSEILKSVDLPKHKYLNVLPFLELKKITNLVKTGNDTAKNGFLEEVIFRLPLLSKHLIC